MLRKVIAGLITMLLIPTTAVAQWEPGGPLPPNTHLGVSLVEQLVDVFQQVSLAYSTTNGSNSRRGLAICPEIDAACVKPAGVAVLPVCEAADDNFCIEKVAVTREGGEIVELQHVRNLTGNTYRVPAGSRFPAGGTQSLWAPADDPSKIYTADVSLDFYSPQTGGLGIAGFSATVYPTELKPDPFSATPIPSIRENGQIIFGSRPYEGCNWNEDGVCGSPLDFTNEADIELTLRVGPEVSGFFFGRIGAGIVETTGLNSRSNRMVISGAPMTVPGLSHDALISEYSKSTLDELKRIFSFMDVGSAGRISWDASSPRASQVVSALAAEVDDRSSGERRIWNIGTGLWVERINPCLKSGSKITGVLTTNAMAYSGNAPTFNGAFLDYKVAGMHYTSTGEKFTGTYDLAIRSEVARCLYGFSKAPVSATVTVVDEKGKPTIATTTVSESDGWLRLAAYGFSFSEKRIQAVLQQSSQKTLTSYVGSTTSLTNKQKLEIREMVGKTPKGGKFICTGIRYVSQPMSENIKVRARAKEACAYAKRLNPNLSFWYQTKTTQARSYSGKVLINTKVPAN